MITDILARVKTPEPLQLDISDLPKGIDNYHLDVKLSAQFCDHLQRLITDLLQQEASIKKILADHEESFVLVRESYLDMMTVLIHRIKTDLNLVEINFLQFSIPKYILQTVKERLDKFIDNERAKSTELRTYGSGKVLGVHEHLAWLSKNYSSIYYEINKLIFTQLQRVEIKNLKPVRAQYLKSSPSNFSELLFNPMLMTRDLNLPSFLVDQHLYWQGNADTNEFNTLNTELEKLAKKLLPALDKIQLQNKENRQSSRLEIYDELDGLANSKIFLGPALDSSTMIKEKLCWLDSTGNMKFLFNLDNLKQNSAQVRKENGIKAWWQYLADIRKLEKISKAFLQIIQKQNLLLPFIATYQARKLWTKNLSIKIDSGTICQYLSGQITEEQLNKRLFSAQKFTDEELSALKNSTKEITEDAKKQAKVYTTNILTDIAEFRLRLKQYRFSHRLFNRMTILTDPDEILLSKQATTLYQLPVAAEIEEGERRISHHTVMKADVRGSTVVTEELEKNGLNPASYFSLRFFGPINKVLPHFGANKVFIEGDAIILSFLEYEHSPQQWFSVAYACGLARAMLSIIKASNRYSNEMGLPPLEVGIGICFSDGAPRFLYDGEQPIMISSAIAQADKLSSCTWKLRKAITPGLFNVEVLAMKKGEESEERKEQRYIRYNINGILLERKAFEKLKTEISLRLIKITIDNIPLELHYGEYIDMEGKEKDLMIREGKIGLWDDNQIKENPNSDEKFYEVVSNTKIISLVRKNMERQTESS
ncbi:hypothetical protein OAP18_02920 [Gammaproteobacteria bacterium]|nr:hypothetical protein [Gammaproteobacteria bacterium]